MPNHGEVTQQFIVYNAQGPDLVLTRFQALTLHHQLTTHLNAPKLDQMRPEPTKKKK